MGLFSNLFKKKPAKKSSEDIMAEYLQAKALNGEKLNAKDYFAKDVLSNTVETKFIAALKSALGTSEIESCGNGVMNDWDETIKFVTMSIFISGYNDDGVMIVLGVDGEANKNDVVDVWIGDVDEPNISIKLGSYPDDATDASFIYADAAQKVKDFLSSKGLL